MQLDSYETTRISIGINPYDFSWKLDSGESFQTPEAVMTYSDSGFGGMSRQFHDFYRKHLLRGSHKDRERPVLLNNWEATYFDFNEEKIVQLAEEGRELGIELMVLDDGWFKDRNRFESSLGDWTVDTGKLPGGLERLSEKIHALDMKFGIWFEPEMVSEDSDLYRRHPEWCLGIPNRNSSYGRMQLVLDLTREDVRDYLYDSISEVLKTADVDYVKWDMNRNITEPGSKELPEDKMQETGHRYILGLYELMERLTCDFPDVLFESCSSGGGRFDLGMLYYMPQTWTSDNTDAVSRLNIQYGTSLTYLAVTMGAHVSTVPNHQVGRITPLKTRGDVAMAGNLGYELDLNALSKDEKREIKAQINFYKKYRKLIQFGNQYRLIDTTEGNEAAWMYTDQEQSRCLVTYVKLFSLPSALIRILKLNGLDPESLYRDLETGECFGGDELMYAGISIPRVKEDFHSMTWVFEKVSEDKIQ